MTRRHEKNSRKTVAKQRPWWRPGPGTTLALIVGAAVVGWQISRPADTNAGRVVYEADAHGHLRRVDFPSQKSAAQAPLPPLWKPEPDLLLQHGPELGLTTGQRQAIQKMDAAWSQEKADWRKWLSGATGDTGALLQRSSTERSAPLAAVRSSLEHYSRLSEEYDRRRVGFWMQATEKLTFTQRRQLDRIRLAVNKKA